MFFQKVNNTVSIVNLSIHREKMKHWFSPSGKMSWTSFPSDWRLYWHQISAWAFTLQNCHVPNQRVHKSQTLCICQKHSQCPMGICKVLVTMSLYMSQNSEFFKCSSFTVIKDIYVQWNAWLLAPKDGGLSWNWKWLETNFSKSVLSFHSHTYAGNPRAGALPFTSCPPCRLDNQVQGNTARFEKNPARDAMRTTAEYKYIRSTALPLQDFVNIAGPADDPEFTVDISKINNKIRDHWQSIWREFDWMIIFRHFARRSRRWVISHHHRGCQNCSFLRQRSGWSLWLELARVENYTPLFDQLAEFYNLMEKAGVMPSTALVGDVSLIPKASGRISYKDMGLIRFLACCTEYMQPFAFVKRSLNGKKRSWVTTAAWVAAKKPAPNVAFMPPAWMSFAGRRRNIWRLLRWQKRLINCQWAGLISYGRS